MARTWPGHDLEGPDLEGPDLEGPDLEGPDLEGPDLEGADAPSRATRLFRLGRLLPDHDTSGIPGAQLTAKCSRRGGVGKIRRP